LAQAATPDPGPNPRPRPGDQEPHDGPRARPVPALALPLDTRIAIVRDNFSPHLSTRLDSRDADWARE